MASQAHVIGFSGQNTELVVQGPSTHGIFWVSKPTLSASHCICRQGLYFTTEPWKPREFMHVEFEKALIEDTVSSLEKLGAHWDCKVYKVEVQEDTKS